MRRIKERVKKAIDGTNLAVLFLVILLTIGVSFAFYAMKNPTQPQWQLLESGTITEKSVTPACWSITINNTTSYLIDPPAQYTSLHIGDTVNVFVDVNPSSHSYETYRIEVK